MVTVKQSRFTTLSRHQNFSQKPCFLALRNFAFGGE